MFPEIGMVGAKVIQFSAKYRRIFADVIVYIFAH